MKKVYIKTFGCQMNEYDTDKIHDVLREQSGFSKTDDINQADVVLLNTCSIREKAQEKVFSDLGRIREIKKHKPDLIIGVGGCVASQEGKNIVSRAPYVDVVFGPQTLHRLPELLAKRAKTGRSQVDIEFVEIEKFDHLPPPRVEKATAFVSIMEGCSKYCSYCIVPYTRGEEVSRPFDDVLTEIADLADQGVKEINLLGQNVNGYLGKMGDTSEIADFATLLETMAHIEGIERIRFTTSHPNHFDDRLINAFAKVPQLVNHLHLPVQSGSDRILSAMKRGYT
ncbi:MAG: tRNA (N6-isopentenyl adenosine(37)-C2)-methylthiotransferase MiaB, partial [Hydromonas sp.]|nr:tRNA (N6-isopentenyl adenosine(37)-C2)-methylthiotransferase MiaB [Hydromonas sp.]